jgi:rod shape determining protein RodA
MSKSKGTISKGIDPVLVWLYLLLVGIGITAIFGVTYKEGDPIVSSFFAFKTDYSKQLYFFAIGIVMGTFILLTDSKFFTATANLWYAMGIVLLLLVFPFHSRVKGTESIIRFGGFQFQPAEFCKVCVCLALAKYLSRVDLNFTRPRAQLIAAGIALLPAVLAKLQHETGLALVYFAFFIVMYREGLNPMVLVIGFAVAVLIVASIIMEPNTLAIILTAVAALMIYALRRQIRRNRSLLAFVVAIWFVCVAIQRFAVPYIFDHVFEPYQSQRILATVGKDYVPKDPKRLADMQIAQAGKKKDDNYNVKQSKIAIGSGGLLGKGLLRGTQTRYDFVPEQRTDFIFCTVGEGFGFLGTLSVLCIYLLLLFRIVAVAERQRSAFSRCYAYGVASVLFFHIVVNVCMTVGLAPVIGIPLPFISYGGTALITFTLLLFILIRLDADRQMVLR